MNACNVYTKASDETNPEEMTMSTLNIAGKVAKNWTEYSLRANGKFDNRIVCVSCVLSTETLTRG